MPTIRVAHSPDADDAFMFWALATRQFDTGDRHYEHVLVDIETLNQAALSDAPYELTAISFHAYPELHARFQLTACGASIGDGYGPKVVTHAPATRETLCNATIAIPGLKTTAALVTRLWLPEARAEILPFDEVLPAVADGRYAAGVIIHEGQLTYADSGVHECVDLGAWWKKETGMPLPLGANAIRRDLGPALCQAVTDDLYTSIVLALTHREQALEHAMQYARGLAMTTADRFVAMYVNEFTVDMGEAVVAAATELYRRAAKAGLLEEAVVPDVLGVTPEAKARHAAPTG